MDVHQTPDQAVEFVGAIDGPLPPGVLAGGQYDVVLCTEVLEHVVNWLAAFANLSRLLAPGGRLILTCPHFYQLHEEPYDFWRPTSYAVEWFAQCVKLEVESLERLGNAWDVLGGVLANVYPIPRQRRWIDRLEGRLLRVALFRFLFPMLRRRWFHCRFEPNSKLYLANAAVLSKPPSPRSGNLDDSETLSGQPSSG